MMSEILRNIAKGEVLALKDTVSYTEGQVVSKTLVQNTGVGITLFAFAKGEGCEDNKGRGRQKWQDHTNDAQSQRDRANGEPYDIACTESGSANHLAQGLHCGSLQFASHDHSADPGLWP